MRRYGLAVLLLLSACSNAPPDVPFIAFTFPPTGSSTDRATLTVTGTTDRVVSGVTVNGEAAASADGFRTWSVVVSLTAGVTTLRAEADGGATELDVVRTDTAMSRPSGLAHDPTTNTVWIVDQEGALVEIDLDSGARRRVDQSGPTFDREYAFGLSVVAPQDVAVDIDSRFAFVTSHNAVMRVHLDTGARSLFATGNVPGMGTPPFGIQRGGSIYISQDLEDLLVCDRDRHALLRIDRTTRVQTVIVSGESLTGLVRAMHYDPHRDFVYSFLGDVKRIDPESGDVVVVSAAGTGPDISPNAIGADVGPGADLLYIADPGLQEIIEVDLIGGGRRVLPGSGVAFVDPRDLVYDTPRNRLLVIDRGLDALIAVSLATGQRTIAHGDVTALPHVADVHAAPDGRLLVLHGSEVQELDGTPVAALSSEGCRRVVANGSGTLFLTRPGTIAALEEASGVERIVAEHPDLEDPHALVLAGPFLYTLGAVSTSLANALARVDPGTGTFDVIAGSDLGVPFPLTLHPLLTYDPLSDRLLSPRSVGSSGNLRADLLEIDPQSGVSSAFTTFRSGDGKREQIAIDPEGRRLFVASTRQLVVLDLDTGAESRVDLAGVPPLDPAALAYWNGLLYLADRDWGAVLVLHPETGDSVFASR